MFDSGEGRPPGAAVSAVDSGRRPSDAADPDPFDHDSFDHDLFDPAVAVFDDPEPDLPDGEWTQLLDPPEEAPSAAEVAPSGFAALELDLATGSEATLSDAEIIDAIVGYQRLTGWTQARQARLLAEFARRRPGDDRAAVGCDTPSMISRYAPDEIGMALTLSRGTAMIRLGRSVRLAGPLRSTRVAWEDGRLDEAKVRAIDDATTYLSDEHAAAVQDRVLPRAPGQGLAALRAALARAVIAVDPHGADERHRKARRDRRVGVGKETEGMASLWALLAAPDAYAAHEWLTRLARGLGTDDPRGLDARRADLLAALLTGRLTVTVTDDDPDPDPDIEPDPDPEPGSGPHPGTHTDGGDAEEQSGVGGTGAAAEPNALGAAPEHRGTAQPPRAPRMGPVSPGKPLIEVLVPYSTLTGATHEPCEFVGYGAIPPDMAREIAADAVWRRLVTDPLSGALLDHGRTIYRPPAALADHVRARDQYCRRPHCGRRASGCDLEHAVPYPHGPTADTNLWCACPHDHRLKHAAGWSVTLHPDGRLTWTTPTGHRHTTDPYDYRSAPWSVDDPPPPTRPDPGQDTRAAPADDPSTAPTTGSPQRPAPRPPLDDDPPPF